MRDPLGGIGEHLRDGHLVPPLGGRGGPQHVAQEGVDFLGPVPLHLGTARLPDCGHHSGDQGGDHQGDRDRSGAVPRDELPESVAGRCRLSDHRQSGRGSGAGPPPSCSTEE